MFSIISICEFRLQQDRVSSLMRIMHNLSSRLDRNIATTPARKTPARNYTVEHSPPIPPRATTARRHLSSPFFLPTTPIVSSKPRQHSPKPKKSANKGPNFPQKRNLAHDPPRKCTASNFHEPGSRPPNRTMIPTAESHRPLSHNHRQPIHVPAPVARAT